MFAEMLFHPVLYGVPGEYWGLTAAICIPNGWEYLYGLGWVRLHLSPKEDSIIQSQF